MCLKTYLRELFLSHTKSTSELVVQNCKYLLLIYYISITKILETSTVDQVNKGVQKFKIVYKGFNA